MLLTLTALLEVGTGLMLLLSPRVPLEILIGFRGPASDILVVARMAGSALLAIGVAAWLARSDDRTPSQTGVLAGSLVYNLAVAAVLAYAALTLRMSGIALWSVVALHAALGGWCCVCLRAASGAMTDSRGRPARPT
jgi:hypothetical protein